MHFADRLGHCGGAASIHVSPGTAIAYCTKLCTGSCHIYTTTKTPPVAHADWPYSPGQGGDPRKVDTVAPGADFWWCYAKNTSGTTVGDATTSISVAEITGMDRKRNGVPTLPPPECTCTSGPHLSTGYVCTFLRPAYLRPRGCTLKHAQGQHFRHPTPKGLHVCHSSTIGFQAPRLSRN
jgi:hypothetical protein